MEAGPLPHERPGGSAGAKFLHTLRKAEFVLQRRTDRLLLVLERCTGERAGSCLRLAPPSRLLPLEITYRPCLPRRQ
jgi:hypothetical protein